MSTPLQDINAKVALLKSSGFSVGKAVGTLADAGYGGSYQVFEDATIYWHAQTGAHEVHGNIAATYDRLGRYDKHPTSGKRLLGFPSTDEADTADVRCRVSRFEWGAIYSLNGGAAVWGKLYDAYREAGGEQGRLGYPVAEPVEKGGGELAQFEFGCLWYGTQSNGNVLEFNWDLPQLGQPWMVKPSAVPNKSLGKVTTRLDRAAVDAIVGSVFADAFLLIQAGGGKQTTVKLRVLAAGSSVLPGFKQYTLAMDSTMATQLKNRTLYSLCVKHPVSAPVAIAAHSIYVRNDWRDFKFMHATDAHLSRRLDAFRDVLRAADLPKGVTNFNNFNESFRLFVRYANEMHSRGELDFVLLTGDIVDYVFEDGQRSPRNNNFAFFEELVTGKARASEGSTEKLEALRVPVFTNLGNHDYRVKSYYPFMNVYAKPGDVVAGAADLALLKLDKRLAKLGFVGAALSTVASTIVHLASSAVEGIVDAFEEFVDLFGGSDDTVSFKVYSRSQYDALNMVKKEAVAVTGKKVNVFTDRALAMVNPDEDNRNHSLDYYFKHINRDQSYTVKLDEHRIVMIDGKWDSDPIDTLGETLAYGAADKIPVVGGSVSEDALHFAAGSPNSVGFDPGDLQLVQTALGASGLVIVGVHCPSLTPAENECPYFLRESVRANFSRAFEPEMQRYLKRRGLSEAGWSLSKSRHFAKGLGENLDFGVMRQRNTEFMKLIAGVDGNRAADLVLAGHTHINWESRIKWDAATRSFAIFSDFYTENPPVYYHTGNNADYITQNIHVTVSDGAPAEIKVTKDAAGKLHAKTPSNMSSLDKQNASPAVIRDWWEARRPLMLQTEALGPMKTQRGTNVEPQPDLRGCRHIAIAGNLIHRVHAVTLPEMSAVLSQSPANKPLPLGEVVHA